ncbi:MAG: helix-turn-helix transcriptional regulator, partial [Armatimonadetes bacterium]|nr:helix-turn-helix transcriptional regulator [Armatimonadota bacterium]
VRVRQIFGEALGVPPARYVTLRRIAHAGSLLAHTELPCVEIAARCGFADPRHFSRVFSRVTGLRPTRYREQARLRRD